MLGITPLAQEKLTSLLAEKKLALKVRIVYSSGGCGDGEGLTLVPDHPAPDDISVDFGPLTLCLSRDLHALVGRVLVDYRDEDHDNGFVVESEYPPDGDGDCAGCTVCD